MLLKVFFVVIDISVEKTIRQKLKMRPYNRVQMSSLRIRRSVFSVLSVYKVLETLYLGLTPRVYNCQLGGGEVDTVHFPLNSIYKRTHASTAAPEASKQSPIQAPFWPNVA